jgi:hypothetical protein
MRKTLLFESQGVCQWQALLEDAHDQPAGKDSLTKHVTDINAVNSVKNRMTNE